MLPLSREFRLAREDIQMTSCSLSPSAERKRAKGDFRGLLLSNQTHRSRSDGEARLFRKSGGTGAFLSYLGHCLMDNRHGLVVASEVTPADGYGERAAALRMARDLPGAHQKSPDTEPTAPGRQRRQPLGPALGA